MNLFILLYYFVLFNMIPFTFVLSIFENYFIETNLVNNDHQLEK
jgi:hypothetical protein